MLNIRPSNLRLSTSQIVALQTTFGERARLDAPLGRLTAARVGGPADVLLEARSAGELAEAAGWLWQQEIPFVVLGGGSNVLVSDAGVRGVVILNRAREVRFDVQAGSPTVWAESGANFGVVARQAAQRGLAGLEWAAGIPGTVGGAVVGNAGAHGSDMAASLVMAEILHRGLKANDGPPQREELPPERLEYDYRSSILKGAAGAALVLAARMRLEPSTPQAVQAKLDEFGAYRRRTQPPGASMGSMFKNPPGDYAGRLIEAAELKGARVGEVEISAVHANFFVNRGQAGASDIFALIQLARHAVAERFGVKLELEIELLGEWPGHEPA